MFNFFPAAHFLMETGNFSTIACRKEGPIATRNYPSGRGSAYESVILIIK